MRFTLVTSFGSELFGENLLYAILTLSVGKVVEPVVRGQTPSATFFSTEYIAMDQLTKRKQKYISRSQKSMANLMRRYKVYSGDSHMITMVTPEEINGWERCCESGKNSSRLLKASSGLCVKQRMLLIPLPQPLDRAESVPRMWRKQVLHAQMTRMWVHLFKGGSRWSKWTRPHKGGVFCIYQSLGRVWWEGEECEWQRQGTNCD